jgi:hypothetical protein
METSMKTFYQLATLVLTSALMIFVLAAGASGQIAETAALANLTEGQGLIASAGNPAWDGMSELVLIPGASLMGASSATTILTLGFTGGSTVDIDNMVLYTTPRNGSMITAIKKLTLNKLSNPSIQLTSKTVCPTQPVSATNPCIIKLDKVTGALSPLDDYYFVIYFTLDPNNQSVTGLGQAQSYGALSGWFLYGDETRIGKDGALPTGNAGQAPFFLLSVTNQ